MKEALELLLFRIPLGGDLPPLKFALNGWWIQAVRNDSASLNSTQSQHRLNSEPTPTQLRVNTETNNDQALNDQSLDPSQRSTIDQSLNDQSTINQRSSTQRSSNHRSINDHPLNQPSINQSTINNDQSKDEGDLLHWCNDKCEVITDWIKPQCLTIRSAGIFGGADD